MGVRSTQGARRGAASTLVFGPNEFERLRSVLLENAPLETACFVLAEPVQVAESQWRLIVADVMSLEDDDYRQRTETFLELEASTLAAAVKRARLANRTLILAHTHPVSGEVGPSWVDRSGEEKWVPAVQRRVPDVPHGRMIIGKDSAAAALLGDRMGGEQALRVVEIGRDIAVLADVQNLELGSNARSNRQVLAFGTAGQGRLQSLRVAVIGCGGTGSVVVQQLVYLGIRDFMVIDPDTIEESNLNRVVGATRKDVGRLKVDVARDAILAVEPAARIQVIAGDVRDTAVARCVLGADLFFCCTDSEGSRAVLNQLAYQYLVPGFDMGVVVRVKDDRVTHISGRVQMLSPEQPCLLCGDVLDPEQVRRDLLTPEARAKDRYIQGAEVPQPSVISINSATASLAVTMMLSAVTGIPVAARHQRIRFESGVVTRLSAEAREGCPVCSGNGALGKGDSFAMPGRR